MEELAGYIKKHPGVEESVDEANGNYPIHIATQNGHIHVVELLIKQKVDLNATNNSGNTALHMGRAYDYYWCCRLLQTAGASLSKKNNEGFAAGDGIEGDKSTENAVPGIISAHNAQELNEALDLINKQETVDKSQLVMAGIGKKKSAKALWTAEVDAKFKALCKKF